MPTSPVSQRVPVLTQTVSPSVEFLNQSTYSRRRGEPGSCDFTYGNPHEMPIPALAEIFARISQPEHETWFAYTRNHPAAVEAVVAGLRSRLDLPFEVADIAMTTGAFSAIVVALHAVLDPGDEVIFISPPWFLYEMMITHAGGVPVRVGIDRETFDLDLAAIRAAITPRTRAIIVNSPHNPTGRIFPPDVLTRLAALLTEASVRNDRTIYLLSDEAYSRILFDGARFPSPSAYYPDTLVLYTYGKQLLTPGQRIGFIALAPTMPERAAMRQAIFIMQYAIGYAWPNATLQYALPEIENLSIDLAHYQRKRDRMVGALREMGYTVRPPEGTFYLLPKSPWEDDWAFTELLAERGVFVLPGKTAEMPGYFRISLTASDAMIERSLPVFAAALEHATGSAPLLQGAARTGE